MEAEGTKQNIEQQTKHLAQAGFFCYNMCMSFEYLVILFLLLFLHSFLSDVITYICIIIEEKDLKLFYFSLFLV